MTQVVQYVVHTGLNMACAAVQHTETKQELQQTCKGHVMLKMVTMTCNLLTMILQKSYFFLVLFGICLPPLSLALLNSLTLQLPLCYLSRQQVAVL